MLITLLKIVKNGLFECGKLKKKVYVFKLCKQHKKTIDNLCKKCLDMQKHKNVLFMLINGSIYIDNGGNKG